MYKGVPYAVIAICIILIVVTIMTIQCPECEQVVCQECEITMTPEIEQDRETLYQTSTINALLEGVYDGELTIGEAKEHGDFGIGTFESLDGELVELDGVVYQVKTDGVAYVAGDEMKTPFLTVTHFDADETIELSENLDYDELMTYLDEKLSGNIFYAIKITGDFEYMKTRSVPGQEKPYPTLAEVVADQAVFEFDNSTGTMIGFRTPDYVQGINVPGYHLHYLTEDLAAGGHILDCVVGNVTIELDITPKFFMVLPEEGDFLESELSDDKSEELEAVER